MIYALLLSSYLLWHGVILSQSPLLLLLVQNLLLPLWALGDVLVNVVTQLSFLSSVNVELSKFASSQFIFFCGNFSLYLISDQWTLWQWFIVSRFTHSSVKLSHLPWVILRRRRAFSDTTVAPPPGIQWYYGGGAAGHSVQWFGFSSQKIILENADAIRFPSYKQQLKIAGAGVCPTLASPETLAVGCTIFSFSLGKSAEFF